MSSLYDQYYSETNINYIYNLLADIILKEKSVNLKDNENNKNIFKQKMEIVFKNTQHYQIEKVNKELLSETLTYFLNNKEKTEDNKDFMSEYNKFINNRDDINNSLKHNNKLDEKREDIREVVREDIREDIRETKNKKKKKKKDIVISSKDRLNKDSNRFKYKIKYPDDEITELVSLIIPIEDCILFSSPIISVEINELDLKVLMTCENVIEMNNYKYGIYKSSKNIINKKSDILTININSIYGNEEYDSDILDIKLDDTNILKLENSEDFKIGDTLILSNRDKIEFCKIINVKSGMIELDDIVEFNNNDTISILNSNLQNIITFN